MFRIGEFSKLAKTTVKTLRYYDDIDLFKPAFVDENGYRYYSIEQLYILQRIVELRSFHLGIDIIKKVISGENLLTHLEQAKEEIEKDIQQQQENLSLLTQLIAKAQKGDFMKNYQANQIDLPEYIVFFRHGIIPTMADLTDFILQAGEEAKRNNPEIKCLENDYCFVTYAAKEYQETNVEVEYAQAVASVGKESENIGFKKIKAHKAISVLHKGSYQKLAEAYAYAINWVKEHGFEIVDDIREVYIHGCWDVADENDYLTEIQIPIA